jgi:DNA-binding MarR family transcriptional regulator
VGQVFAADMGTSGLTPRQIVVLITVEQNEGISQTGIVDRTGIDRSTLADVVKRLKSRGLRSAAAPRKTRGPMP